jgi:hypothetical protein
VYSVLKDGASLDELAEWSMGITPDYSEYIHAGVLSCFQEKWLLNLDVKFRNLDKTFKYCPFANETPRRTLNLAGFHAVDDVFVPENVIPTIVTELFRFIDSYQDCFKHRVEMVPVSRKPFGSPAQLVLNRQLVQYAGRINSRCVHCMVPSRHAYTIHTKRRIKLDRQVEISAAFSIVKDVHYKVGFWSISKLSLKSIAQKIGQESYIDQF